MKSEVIWLNQIFNLITRWGYPDSVVISTHHLLKIKILSIMDSRIICDKSVETRYGIFTKDANVFVLNKEEEGYCRVSDMLSIK